MKEAAARLEKLAGELYKKYGVLDDDFCAIQLSEDKWSVKEIFGHLVDSASNNFQRFMRLQEGDLNNFPGYGLEWVKLAPYNSCSWNSLLTLWREHNLLLVHIIANLETTVLSNQWTTDDGTMSLEFLVNDYIRHMEVHRDHLEERVKELMESK
ncbi:MAG: DinB family protein [Spirochaetales bacterium]|nr:DinB family protein [Spirochaetales bacterium]